MQIAMNDTDNDGLHSDLKEAESKYNKLKQESSDKIEILENTLASKNLEIEALHKQIESLQLCVKEQESSKSDGNNNEEAKLNEVIQDISDIMTEVEVDLQNVKTFVSEQATKTRIVDMVKFEDYNNLRQEKHIVDTKLLKVTIEKMELKREVFDLKELLRKSQSDN